MHTVYVLKSLKDNNLYTGCTSDLGNRISEHNKGQNRSTKNRRPFELIFKEEYIDKYEAFKKEKYYKTATGKKELKLKINHCRVV